LLCTHSLRGDYYNCKCAENQSVQNQAQSSGVEESRMKKDNKIRKDFKMFEINQQEKINEGEAQ